MNEPLLSVIVLGFRHFSQTTQPCIESLLPWANDPRVELFLTDNGSDDDSGVRARAWCEQHPEIKFLPSSKNLGFAGGMNWASSYASGEWLLLVNNDTLFPENALNALISVLQTVPSNMAMIGPVTNAAGNAQRLWLPNANTAEMLALGAQLNTSPTGHLFPVYRCDFFCIAVRKSVWQLLGGLDTHFGLGYYEDFDFSLRVRQAGWEQAISEDVFILHVGSATFKASKQAKLLMKINKKLLKKKHPHAQFLHARTGNLEILKAYKDRGLSGNGAVNLRRALRVQALLEDAPRSFWKKWIWERKIKFFVNQA
jgi:GT2 family glycosyltransferase